VYGLGGRAGNNRLMWFDRSGNRVRTLTAFGNYLSTALARDGRRLAVEWQQRPLADIWTIDVMTGAKSRVTTNPDDESQVIWAPDGQHVLFGGRRGGRYRICQMRADGAGTEQQIREDAEHDVWPYEVSGDGKWLLFGVGSAQGTPHGALWIAPFAGGDARMLVPASDDVQGARLSPDSKWLAFDASVSGRREVYVSPLSFSGDGLSARWQVSASGGDRPRWRADGRELYYVRADGYVMAVSLDANASDFRAVQETPLFQAFQRIDTATIEPSADGQYFSVNVLGGDTAEPLAVVTNWKQTLTVP
jgi:Tol biopolymer transport system component